MILRPPTSTHRHPLALLDALPIFKNILLPTSYITGQEVIPFAAAMAPHVKNINMLTAMRTGEIHPTMLARHISTLDHILEGRLTINIINSTLDRKSVV